MKYFRRYVDEDKKEKISQKEYHERLGNCYNDTQCFDDDYYNKDNQIRTPFAFYWCQS